MPRLCLDHIYTETETFVPFSDYTWHSILEPAVESATIWAAVIAGYYKIAKRIEASSADRHSDHPSHSACLADGDDGAVFLQALIRYSVHCFVVVSAEGLGMAFAETAVAVRVSRLDKSVFVIVALFVLHNSVSPAEN